jgi:hypothetical protein
MSFKNRWIPTLFQCLSAMVTGWFNIFRTPRISRVETFTAPKSVPSSFWTEKTKRLKRSKHGNFFQYRSADQSKETRRCA